MHRYRSQVLCASAALAIISGGIAVADTYECTLAAPSSATNTGQLQLPLVGTLVGNYDATTNPTGTQTRPGLFGGSGNVPINYTSTIVGDAGFTTTPIGAFTMNLSAMPPAISGLGIDLLGNQAQEFGITLNINYQTFRTFSPNSLFPGGVTIPVPLAAGSISELQAVQTGPAPMLLGTPDAQGTPFTAAVPVEITLQASVNGAPFGGAPTPGILPVTGRFTVTGNTITVTASFDVPAQTVEFPAPPAIEAQALPLPTVLPAGGTANLLLNGTFSPGTFSAGLAGTLSATGERQRTGDINGDGVVNATDLSTLLAAWASSSPACDLDDNGTVNAADLTIMLVNWG